MTTLIMLGIIPGTAIQISFEAWLAVMLGIASLIFLLAVHRSHIVPILLIVLVIRSSFRHATLPLRWA